MPDSLDFLRQMFGDDPRVKNLERTIAQLRPAPPSQRATGNNHHHLRTRMSEMADRNLDLRNQIKELQRA